MTVGLSKRLCLGTAAFGLDYGIANKAGRVPPQETHRILNASLKAGVDTWDTAVAYGESERVLGDFLRQSEHHPNLISKLSNGHSRSLTIERVVWDSLERLNVDHLFGYLIHNFEDYARDEGIFQVLLTLREKGIVKKVGFSLYLPEHLEFLLDKGIPLDIVQVPYSIFDRRFDDYFPILHEQGIEIHVRSIFLQGLIFLKLEDLIGSLTKARPKVAVLQEIAAHQDIPTGAIALNFALCNPRVSKVLIGVDRLSQLEQNLIWLNYFQRVKALGDMLTSLSIQDENVLLPYKWVS